MEDDVRDERTFGDPVSTALLEAMLENSDGVGKRMAGELLALRADVEALRKDAERYRWLRDVNQRIDYTSDWKAKTPKGRLIEAITVGVQDCFKITLPLFHTHDSEPIWKDGGHIDWQANMDAAIDAALSQAGQPK